MIGSRPSPRRTAVALALALAAALVPAVAGRGPAAAAASDLQISVLSNRADLISDGDALVGIELPQGVDPGKVKVSVDGRDVSDRFAVRPGGEFQGLVTDLSLGSNELRATAPGYAGQAVVTNHPNGGPVFSGPQSRHYVCQPGATDGQCNQPATYQFLYRSTNPLTPGLRPYDPDNPPRDVATTTTDQGIKVPFIVRQETGYQARDQYTILTLFRPGQTWKPWSPQEQWNSKVLITHGGSCGASLTPGVAPLDGGDGTYTNALSRGFAVMSTALDNTGHNCNLVTAAESLVMAKERLVEQYGPIRYTIGVGCSGGSIAEQTIANAYPGIYQGLVTSCTYPDAVTTAAQFADYHLLRKYFENPARWGFGVLWSPTQLGTVEGHLSHLNAVVADEAFFSAAVDPSHPCPGSRPTQTGDSNTRYDARTNPGGTRCSALEMMANPLGPRPQSVWSAAEKAAGRGFTGIPIGNVGVMYGLRALEKGLITRAQFVDLNVKVGGLDVDSNRTDGRMQADRGAVENSYRTGLINEFQNVSGIPIINHGGPDPGFAHDYNHAYWVEERLHRSQGHTLNRVMWFGTTPLIGDPRWANEALVKIDAWLTAVEADDRDIPLAEKVAQDRPADVNDRCSNIPGIELIPGPDGKPLCEMPELQTNFSTPRAVAGGGPANDTNECQLKPLTRSDIAANFSDAQWGRLQKVFSTGVCDWTAPGHGADQANQTWLTYGNAEDPIYGGANLPSRPAQSQTAWTAPSFRELLDR